MRLPFLGFGLGLRTPYYQSLLTQPPAVDFLEIPTEDYLVEGGPLLDTLERIRARYPVVLHGVSLSIGSSDPLDKTYLAHLKQLATRIQPAWISDHLCWTGVDGINLHDLMPLPHTEAALQHVVGRVQQVQEFLNQQILLENVSSYLSYRDSELTEWEFLTEIAERADCLILLDINNIYVSAFNHGFEPERYLENIPRERVQQFHLAGYTHCGTHIIDTHDAPVEDPVWQLYRAAAQQFGPVSTVIERDDKFPPFSALWEELQHARRMTEPLWLGPAEG